MRYWRKPLESPLEWKEIKGANSKGNQSWILFGRADADTGTWIIWPPNVKNWLIGKEPYAEKDWRLEERTKTEDETLEWHHWLYGHGFEQALWVGDGNGSLICCNPWHQKESDMTEWLNGTHLKYLGSQLKENGKELSYHQLKILIFPNAS